MDSDENTIKLCSFAMKLTESTPYTVADFFCGAGGFSEGFRQAGFNVTFALDNWKPATQTHDLNHTTCTTTHMNILKLDTIEKIDKVIPDTDIIVGSPPCVSFSNSNKSGKADKTLGVQLITQFLKIVLYKKTKKNSTLKYWIMENVPNSIKFVKDEYTALELGLPEHLPNLKVRVQEILIASDYGAPQGRKRAIVGDYPVPHKTHENSPIQTRHILTALGPPLNNPKTLFKDPLYSHITLSKAELTDHFYNTDIPEYYWKRSKRLKTDHGFMGRMDFPDRTNRLCRTIMATESNSTREAIIFKKENDTGATYRSPTIREISSLMGFPIDYIFLGKNTNTKHKQIGNAVCVQMSQALAQAIKKDANLKYSNAIEIRRNHGVGFNLNDSVSADICEFVIKPKRITSKFAQHPPYIKKESLRVELSNRTSVFDKLAPSFEWTNDLHRGAGKGAQKIKYTNDKLAPHILNSPHFENYKQSLEDYFNGKINDALLFQKKNCYMDISDSTNPIHLSPEEALAFISNKITGYDIADERIEIDDLDAALNYTKQKKYPLEVIYSLYGVNTIVNKLQ